MPRRPASITQADVARIIRAAKQAGAAEVVIPVNGEQIIVRLAAAQEKGSQKKEIVL